MAKKKSRLVSTKKLIGETNKSEKRAKQRARAEKGMGPGYHPRSLNAHMMYKGHKEVQNPTDVDVYWDDTAPWSKRTVEEVSYIAPKGVGAEGDTTWVKIQFVDKPEYLEIYSIDVRPKGTGYGTYVMNDLKAYAASKNKGIILTKVQNERFAESQGFKRRDKKIDGRPMSETTGFAEYVWGDVPKDAIDYDWVTSGGRPKTPPESITRHGELYIKITKPMDKGERSRQSIRKMFEEKGWLIEELELSNGQIVLYGTHPEALKRGGV